MATSNRNDPLLGFNFRVEIDGVQSGGFHEVSGLDSVQELIEYREGNEKTTCMRKLAGLSKFSNIVLKRGITHNLDLWQWRKLVMDGKAQDARRNVSIVLNDAQGQEVARWSLINAWPIKWVGPSLNATGDEVAIETLELVHEGLDRVS